MNVRPESPNADFAARLAAAIVVPFTDAEVGDEAYVYVDEDCLSEHYCVFKLACFDERDGEIQLRRQRWKLLEDEALVLPGPIQPDEDDESPDLGIVFLGSLGDEATP